jgi:hypothetical protein
MLVGFVMADRTTRGRPQQAMVACEVSGGGTDRRSFDATFGISGLQRLVLRLRRRVSCRSITC